MTSSAAVESGFAHESVLDYRPYTYWRSAGTATGQHLQADAGQDIEVDYCGLLGWNPVETDAAFTLLGLPDGEDPETGTFQSVFTVAQGALTDNGPFLREFDSVSYRYWRIRWNRMGGLEATPFLAVWFLGRVLTFAEYLPATFEPDGYTVDAESQVSRGGHWLGSVVRRRQREHRYSSTRRAPRRRSSPTAPSEARAASTRSWTAMQPRCGHSFFVYDTHDPDYSQAQYLMLKPGSKVSRPFVGSRRRRGLDIVAVDAFPGVV